MQHANRAEAPERPFVPKYRPKKIKENFKNLDGDNANKFSNKQFRKDRTQQKIQHSSNNRSKRYSLDNYNQRQQGELDKSKYQPPFMRGNNSCGQILQDGNFGGSQHSRKRIIIRRDYSSGKKWPRGVKQQQEGGSYSGEINKLSSWRQDNNGSSSQNWRCSKQPSNQHSYSNEPKRLMARKPDDLPTASYSSDDLKLELEQRMKRAAEKRAREKSRKDKSQQPHERRGIARKSLFLICRANCNI